MAGLDGPPAEASSLLQLDLRAAEILRVQEQHRLAVGTDAWLTVAKYPCAAGRQSIPGRTDILYLVAYVVHATGGMALEERGDGRLFAQRVQQLDLGIRELHEDGGDAVGRLLHRLGDARPQGIPIDGAGGGDLATAVALMEQQRP